MNTIIPNEILNIIFITLILSMVLYAVYQTAFHAGVEKWRHYSRPILISNILFYGVGGTAFASFAIVGIMTSGEVNYQLSMGLFVLLTLSGGIGLYRGITADKEI